MNELGIKNLIKKDLENIKQFFCRDTDSQQMLSFITKLQSMNCEVRYQVNEEGRVKSVFLIHAHGIEEARRMPQCIVADATYKTNAHKMVLVNFVIAGTVCGKEKRHQLTTIPIAGSWISREKEEDYRWTLQQLRNIVWNSDMYELPSVFVTDNDRALRNGLTTIFPESKTLLCFVHVARNFEKKFLGCLSDKVVKSGNVKY